jgi:inhibitor of KinA
MLSNDFKIVPLGDNALKLILGETISLSIHRKINQLVEIIKNEIKNQSITDILPTYKSIVIYFDPGKLTFDELKTILSKITLNPKEHSKKKDLIKEIPVCYGGYLGPDLKIIAEEKGLTEKNVIEIHSKELYTVFMIGFTPGFPYLGIVPPEIQMPRMATPRKIVFKGSVGIANEQTGIYSTDNPGGWRIIGRTPINLFNNSLENPSFLESGNRVKFTIISENEFKKIENSNPY